VVALPVRARGEHTRALARGESCRGVTLHDVAHESTLRIRIVRHAGQGRRLDERGVDDVVEQG
jgi:hypothetical protein